MTKLIIAVLMLGTVSIGTWADSYGLMAGLLQFHGSIAELTAKNATIDPNKLYLVEGMITSMNIVNDSDTEYYAESEFMSAEYVDNEAIVAHRVMLVFSKPAFKPLLVPKSLKSMLNGQIGINSRGLALVQYINSIPGSSGDKIPVFLAHDFRILK